jgi:hypothetical protein
VIRDNAHLALQDLREVIGVLRARVGELPQPTLAEVAQLVAESGGAGMGVGLGEELGGVVVPALVGRTAYRVVQEGLTMPASTPLAPRSGSGWPAPPARA